MSESTNYASPPKTQKVNGNKKFIFGGDNQLDFAMNGKRNTFKD